MDNSKELMMLLSKHREGQIKNEPVENNMTESEEAHAKPDRKT